MSLIKKNGLAASQGIRQNIFSYVRAIKCLCFLSCFSSETIKCLLNCIQYRSVNSNLFIFVAASGPHSAWRKAWHFYPDVAGSICVMSFCKFLLVYFTGSTIHRYSFCVSLCVAEIIALCSAIVGCLGLIYYVNYLGPRATMYKNRYCSKFICTLLLVVIVFMHRH